MSVFKIEDLVDHRMDLVLANESIHGFQITAAAHTDGFVAGLAKCKAVRDSPRCPPSKNPLGCFSGKGLLLALNYRI